MAKTYKFRKDLRYAVVSSPEPATFYDQGMTDDLVTAMAFLAGAIRNGTKRSNVWIYDRKTASRVTAS